jgi:hypothetical protein
MRDTGTLRKQRSGVCHRCGWTGLVGRVPTCVRLSTPSRGAYGRLCEECVADLINSQPTRADTPETQQVTPTTAGIEMSRHLGSIQW